MRQQIETKKTYRVLLAVLACCVGALTFGNSVFGDSAEDWGKMKGIEPRGYVCGFTSDPVVVDGKIDEPAWESANWTDEFLDIEGDKKPKPRYRTRAKMLWNKEFLFIAAKLDEPHVWGTLKEHDSVIFYDNDFEVFIDPNGDNHEYYELELNALNTTWDLFLPKPYKDGGKADHSWEINGLKTAVDIQGTLNDPSDQDTGWSVEIAIPWKALREFAHQSSPPEDGDRWRVNFSRVEWKHAIVGNGYKKVPETREDNWVWSPQGIIDMHRPERWGYVVFSETPGKQRPYVADHATRARDLLMEVYHRQKSYHAKGKRWATTLAELELQKQRPDFPHPIEMRSTKDGFVAFVDVPNPNGTIERWRVRQDSKLWLDEGRGKIPNDPGTAAREDTESLRPLDRDANKTNANKAGQRGGQEAPLAALRSFLAEPASTRGSLAERPFAAIPLTRADAKAAAQLLWEDFADRMRKERRAEMEANVIKIDEWSMPFTYRVFGKKPPTGRSLYISMHGGGGAPKRINDQQWENQKRLYRLDEGVYLVPRAPTDTWNLWHQSHIDQFFARLIENLIVFEDVDPNRIYIMGYSAGGDGVYQLAPRMADQLAAASMMAGHPNETSPLGLRNLPFTIHVGEHDSGYKRNAKAREFGEELGQLREDDPQGYLHEVTLHKGKGHWMDRQDAVAIPWMAQYKRKAFPDRIVWKQDDVIHERFYWLAVDPEDLRKRAEVRADVDGQVFTVRSSDVDRLTIRLSDDFVDLDQPVTVRTADRTLFSGVLPRTIAMISKALGERGDPVMLFTSEVTVDLKEPE